MNIRVATFDNRREFEDKLNAIGEANILQMMDSICMSSYGTIRHAYTVVYRSRW